MNGHQRHEKTSKNSTPRWHAKSLTTWTKSPPAILNVSVKPMRHQLRSHWAYRIGDYQAITKHYNDTLVIFAMKVMHQSKVYGDH